MSLAKRLVKKPTAKNAKTKPIDLTAQKNPKGGTYYPRVRAVLGQSSIPTPDKRL